MDNNAIANPSPATMKWTTSPERSRRKQNGTGFPSGKLAEIVGEQCAQGIADLRRGRLQTRKWQDKDGQDRYTTEIVADRMQMLGWQGG